MNSYLVMDEHHWTVYVLEILNPGICPERPKQRMYGVLPNKWNLHTNILYPNYFKNVPFLKSSFSNPFFFGVFLLFSFRGESNGMQSLIQHCTDLNETKWLNESWMQTVVMQPLQVGCMTALEWLSPSVLLMRNRWKTQNNVLRLEGTWSVCCIYMCSGWFCKQLMNSETGWPW